MMKSHQSLLALSLACIAISLAQASSVTDEARVIVENSIPETIRDALWTQLHTEKTDWINGLVALCFGVALICKAEKLYSWLVVIAVFLGVYLVTANEWIAADPKRVELYRFEAFEMAVLGAFVAYKSMAGINVLLGGLVGYLCAHWIEAMLLLHGYTARDFNPFGIFFMYSVFVVCLAAAFNSKYQIQLFAIAASFAGGALLASALQFWFTFYVTKHCQKALEARSLTPRMAAWVDFWYLLVQTGPVEVDVGIFADSHYNPKVSWIMGQEIPICLDQVIGRVLWFIFFLIGARVQIREIKAPEEKKPEMLEPLLPQ